MYKILKCSNCGKFQVSQAENRFICRFCKKSCLVEYKKIFYQDEDFYKVNIYIKELKKQEFNRRFKNENI